MKSLLRPATFSSRYLCGLLAALTAAGPALPLAAQERQPAGPTGAIDEATAQEDLTLLGEPPVAPAKLNLQYIVPNACAVVVARPSQLFHATALEMLPFEVMQAASLQEVNVDVLKLDQLVISASPPVQGPPTYAVYGEFSEPAPLNWEDLNRHTEAAELAGQSYRRSTGGPMEPSMLQPTPNSILISPDATLRQLVQRQQPSLGDLAAVAAAAAKTDDFFALVDVEPLRPLIGAGLQQAGLPPELQSLTRVPDLVRQIELRINLSNDGKTELVATANNAQDAQAIVSILDGLKQQFRRSAEAQIAQLAASDDPVEQATARYQRRMMKRMDESFQMHADGDRLTVFSIDPNQEGSQSQVTYVAVIGILVALLLPAVQAAREAARRNMSLNNMKNINLALQNFADMKRGFPAHAIYDGNGKALLSWRVQILPMIEQQALYEQFHLDEPWDSEHNRALISQMPEVYLDPSSGLTVEEGRTHYLGVVGDAYAFTGTETRRGFADIRDGTSNTIVVVQVDDEHAVEWTKPEDWAPPAEGDPLTAMQQSPHPGVFIAGFLDGRAANLSLDIDWATFRALLTVDGGEVVNY